MDIMTAADYIIWLSARFYVCFEFSPTDDAKVSVYDINKYGDIKENSRRVFIGQIPIEALKKAYRYESKELVKQ